MPENYIEDYTKQLKGLAKHNRNNGSKAEIALWKYVLKAKQMRGLVFNRQRPVLNYIADFMCKPLQLIIEVDGNTHDDKVAREGDKKRTSALNDAGYTIIRFTNDDVLFNIEWVRKEIEHVVDDLTHQ